MKAIKIILGILVGVLVLVVVLMLIFVPDGGSSRSRATASRTATPQGIPTTLEKIAQFVGKRVSVEGYFKTPLTSIFCYEIETDPTKKFRCGLYLETSPTSTTSTWIFIEHASSPNRNSIILPPKDAPLADLKLYDKSLVRVTYNSRIRVSGYVIIPNSRLAAGKVSIAVDTIEVTGPPPKK